MVPVKLERFVFGENMAVRDANAKTAASFARERERAGSTRLCIELDEDIPPVPVEPRDPDLEVRFRLLVAHAVGADVLAGGYETRLGLPVYLWFLAIEA